MNKGYWKERLEKERAQAAYEAVQLERDKVAKNSREKNIHLDALQTMTRCFNSFGQMMQQLADAMKSEKGQL